MEHIYNKEKLVLNLKKNLKINGRLEIFVPFMYKFHGDPNDFNRMTHTYLEKFLKEKGFRVKITLIGSGQMSVICEIISKYLKFKFLKLIFSIIFILINNLFHYFSKDFNNYFCGIHCSCIKIK